MAKRELLMLAHTYVPNKHGVAMWYMSEKIDGLRAFWDGGVTRGIPCDQIPFANVAKDARLIKRPIATGLWSRYGKVIHAPDWWLNMLPRIPLDGELYAGRQSFQQVASITKQHEPGTSWNRVKLMVLDSPRLEVVLADGQISNANFKKRLVGVMAGIRTDSLGAQARRPEFESVYSFLTRSLPGNGALEVHPQEQLPPTTAAALERLDERLLEVCASGGEGLVIRRPNSTWSPERSHSVLKVKKLLDSEGTVTGCTFGRETDRGSRLLGKVGALILQLDSSMRLELSGLTDDERALTTTGGDDAEAAQYATRHPGEDAPDWIVPKWFPIGSRVTFKYRELSDAGIPKEGRYFRRAT